MRTVRFLDEHGSFLLDKPQQLQYLYFPLAGEKGMKSAITPNLGGDSKIDQNTFLLEPASVENLHNNRNTRNFWCNVEGKGCFSVAGNSAEAIAQRFSGQEDVCSVRAGFMWHTVTRESEKYGLRAETTSFVAIDGSAEFMMVEVTNISDGDITMVPTAMIPIYGRSADNLRDHRHVTSLLHRIRTTEYGVEVKPTLSFDERGHQTNRLIYYVYGVDGKNEAPEDFYPTVEDVIAEGGNFEWPYAVIKNTVGTKAGKELEGKEALGGLHFAKVTLTKGESACYVVLLGVAGEAEEVVAQTENYLSVQKATEELEKVKSYWKEQVNISYKTGDENFDSFMKWVSFQPILRRIYGCSFLPHHDYGKGGRGWRDLWQDCLALLLMHPDGVRQMLLDNFAGVRMDGSNATIIGTKQGEFVADRNNITRVWMDHGVWPFMTTKLYIDQTGDIELLDKEVHYFKDKQICRGQETDTAWSEAYGCIQKTKDGQLYAGSVLEHLLLQNLTAFYEVGEHNVIRLRGADWNDALDMASERGESVAFTNAYAGNLADLADLLETYKTKTGKQTVSVAAGMVLLLEDDIELYDSISRKQTVLGEYLNTCRHDICGEKVEICIEKLAENLRNKAAWMYQHIRRNEWVSDSKGHGWFNGYYDNLGRRVEGEIDGQVRMMLTGQVFSIMAGTADEAQVAEIVKSADAYLYRENKGGYSLNTNFEELKTDLGRMFGFAYGEKENGAVFSHMAVMYANALYKRGFAKEGFRALDALEKQSMDLDAGGIYPGIPEYFNAEGKGLYHYLTGAASWYMLTVITQMYGVRGERGDMIFNPKLLAKQFDEKKEVSLQLQFAEKKWKIVYRNTADKEYGEYKIGKLLLNGEDLGIEVSENTYKLEKSLLDGLDAQTVQEVEIELV